MLGRFGESFFSCLFLAADDLTSKPHSGFALRAVEMSASSVVNSLCGGFTALSAQLYSDLITGEFHRFASYRVETWATASTRANTKDIGRGVRVYFGLC